MSGFWNSRVGQKQKPERASWLSEWNMCQGEIANVNVTESHKKSCGMGEEAILFRRYTVQWFLKKRLPRKQWGGMFKVRRECYPCDNIINLPICMCILVRKYYLFFPISCIPHAQLGNVKHGVPGFVLGLCAIKAIFFFFFIKNEKVGTKVKVEQH